MSFMNQLGQLIMYKHSIGIMYINGKNAITFITYAINLMKREIISTILINTDNKYITKPIKALITCKQYI